MIFSRNHRFLFVPLGGVGDFTFSIAPGSIIGGMPGGRLPFQVRLPIAKQTGAGGGRRRVGGEGGIGGTRLVDPLASLGFAFCTALIFTRISAKSAVDSTGICALGAGELDERLRSRLQSGLLLELWL